jgi:hypothetical protein
VSGPGIRTGASGSPTRQGRTLLRYIGHVVGVGVVGDTVQITRDWLLLRTHRARHDKLKEFGALNNPGGRPRRTTQDVAQVPEPFRDTGTETPQQVAKCIPSRLHGAKTARTNSKGLRQKVAGTGSRWLVGKDRSGAFPSCLRAEVIHPPASGQTQPVRARRGGVRIRCTGAVYSCAPSSFGCLLGSRP